jgi:hypothetical protein
MDEHYKWLGDVFTRDLTKEPSEYFKRQCFVSVECDEEPIKGVFDLIGVANIVFSTDFPHPDCKYPGAVERFLELPLSDTAKRAILWGNCARYYGLTCTAEEIMSRPVYDAAEGPRTLASRGPVSRA